MLTWLLALGTIRYDKFELHILRFCNLVSICKDVFLGRSRRLVAVRAVLLRSVVMCADVCMREC